MATNHQCHCHPTTCYCTICYTTTHYPPPPPPPPPPAPDPLILSFSSHHHHQHHQHAPPQSHHNYYPPPPPPQTHQSHHFSRNYSHQDNAQQNPPPLDSTVSSLIHRIAALESSLRRRKHSPTSSSSYLRDAAARTIQTHFRAFLVQRSVTLRHLKDLAHIKSTLNRLKSSVSNNPQFDSNTIYRESLSLLIKLDSIQGTDPMIRDGKRSISRELIQFMELIDEMCTEKQVLTVKNVRFGKNSINASGSRVLGNQEKKFLEHRKNERKYNNQVEERLNLENPRKSGGSQIRKGDLVNKSQGKSQPKVKKNVSFDENGNVYRIYKSSHNQDSNDDEEVEVEVEEEVEEDDSSETSENEIDPRKNLRTRIHHTIKKNQDDVEDDDDDEEEDDSFVFSAPLPAKMEY